MITKSRKNKYSEPVAQEILKYFKFHIWINFVTETYIGNPIKCFQHKIIIRTNPIEVVEWKYSQREKKEWYATIYIHKIENMQGTLYFFKLLGDTQVIRFKDL